LRRTNLAQKAPAGSEAAIEFLKQAITLANTAQESVQKATKQAVEVAQSNLGRNKSRIGGDGGR
jgi:hypothetical protein